MDQSTVLLIPVGLQWQARCHRRLIATHAVRIECERRALFLGWKIANPTLPVLPAPAAKREARIGLAMLATVSDPTAHGLFRQLQTMRAA